MNSSFGFSCPYCKHQYDDDLELLDTDVQHECKCENCGRQFALLTKDCRMCLGETSFTWQESPTVAQLSSIQCGKCSKLIFAGNEQDEED